MTSNSSSTQVSARSRVVMVVLVLLVAGTVLNVGFNLVLPNTASGIRSHEDNRLSTLVRIERPEVRVVFGFEAYLHDVARGGTITIPDGRAVFRLLVENLSLMTVVEAKYDSEITRERALALNPALEIEAKGTVNADHDVVRYWILTRDDLPVPSLTMYMVGNDVYVIDDRLGAP